jgi:hypothetical protein
VRKSVTLQEIKFVREHYGQLSVVEIAALMKCKHRRVAGIIDRYNLKISCSPIFPKSQGQHNKFKKGHAVTNGSFKKENVPHNLSPEYTIRLKNNGHGYEPTKQIKIQGKWVNYYKWKYNEYHHTGIERNSVVVFLDGNKENENIENIQVISRKESLSKIREENKEMISVKMKIGWAHYKRKKALLNEISKYTTRND